MILRSFLVIIMLLVSSMLFSVWEEVDLNTEKELVHVDFLDDAFGWIYADGRGAGSSLFYTSDGGESWQEQSFGYDMFNCEFATPDTVYGGYIDGLIYYSNDLGSSWTLNQTEYVGLFDQFYFVSSQVGWAAGSGIWITEDGGISWEEQDFIPYGHTWEIAFKTDTFGSRVGFTWPNQKKAYISITSDAGENWNYYEFPEFEEFRSVEYINDTEIIVAGNGVETDVIGRSDDFGASWDFFSEEGGLLQAACFVSETTGWKVSRYGIIKRTNDSGHSWVEEINLGNEPEQKFYDMFFLSEEKGWVCGNNGKLYRYSQETASDQDNIPSPNLIINNYPNPFNPNTNLVFNIPNQALVSLTIYDVKGRKVKTLLHNKVVSGETIVNWDGSDAQNKILPSGVYFAKLEADNSIQYHKMVLMK